MKISEMNIEQLRKHFAELSRDQLLLSLQTREAQLEAAQQSVQADLLPCGHTKSASWDDLRNVCVACEVIASR